MEYEFEIAFKRPFTLNHIHTLKFTSKKHDVVESLVERYGKADTVVFLKEFLSLFSDVQMAPETSSLSEEQLREEVQRLLSENIYLKSAKQSLDDQVAQLSQSRANVELRELRDTSQRLFRDLAEEKNRSNQYYTYYQDAKQYKELSTRWSQLFPQFQTLEELANHINVLKADKDKLQKTKQTSDKRVQEIEKELQETQQKLSLATMRLRSVNTHPELVGESRSDQLKNEFSHLKSTLHDVSSKVLTGWQAQGFKSSARNDFKSEEFSHIKSILSQRVFGDGMTYFAKDKTEVDAELHLVMDALSSIKDFSPTTAVFQEIQGKVQVGLLRAKGVDHSDEAIEKYIEETTQCIDQDLKSIANLETTIEALSEVKKFVQAGLKIVRGVVNDPNSGELFIPENGTSFDDNAHETRDDHPGKIKATICAGYRIKGTILAKADVVTHEPEPTSPPKQQTAGNSQPSAPENPELQGGIQKPENTEDNLAKVKEVGNASEVTPGQGKDVITREPEPTSPPKQQTAGNSQPSAPENPESQVGVQEPLSTGNDDSKVEETGNTSELPLEQDKLAPSKPVSLGSPKEPSEADCENRAPNELEKPSGTFKGKITYQGKLMRQTPKLAFRNRPLKEAKTDATVGYDEILNFEGWVVGGSWKEGSGKNQKEDNRWCKVSGQDWWLPALHVEVEGGLPSNFQLMNGVGDADEAQ